MSSNQWDINIQKSFVNCFYAVIFWAVSDSLHIFHAEACYLWLTLPSAKMSLNSLATSCVANSALKVLLTGVSTLKSRADQGRSSSSLRAKLFFLTRPGPSLQNGKEIKLNAATIFRAAYAINSGRVGNSIIGLSIESIFFTYSQHGPSFINLFVQFSPSDLPPLRPFCGEVPGRDSNPGRADLVAGTLTTRPQHLTP